VDYEQMSTILAVVRRPRPRPDSIEARLRLVEDEQEIVSLVLLYAWLCDGRRWDDIWSLYTEDFSREIPAAPAENVRGVGEVKAMYTPLLESDQRARDAGEPFQHRVRGVVAPPIVRIGEDCDTAHAIATYTVATRHGLPPGAAADLRQITYLWGLRRVPDAGWRFNTLLVLNDEGPSST
jgi:hypothetical protein